MKYNCDMEVSIMKNNLIKLLTVNKDIRIYIVDAKDVLRHNNFKDIKTDFAKQLYMKIITNCCLLRGLLTDKSQRMSISLRFKLEGHSIHCEIDGDGNINCIFSSQLSNFTGNLRELIGKGATLSITRGSWLDGMFTGTVELLNDSVDFFFTHFYSKSEQTKTIFRTWTENGTVRGCMIQTLPFATDNNLMQVVNDMYHYEAYFKTEDLQALPSLVFPYAKVIEEYRVQSECNCSKNMFFGMLMAMDTNELKESIQKNEGVELECGVCGKKYLFIQNDLETIINIKDRR